MLIHKNVNKYNHGKKINFICNFHLKTSTTPRKHFIGVHISPVSMGNAAQLFSRINSKFNKVRIVLFLVLGFSITQALAQRDQIITQAGEKIRCRILDETPNRFIFAYLSPSGKVLRNEIFKNSVSEFKYNFYSSDIVTKGNKMPEGLGGTREENTNAWTRVNTSKGEQPNKQNSKDEKVAQPSVSEKAVAKNGKESELKKAPETDKKAVDKMAEKPQTEGKVAAKTIETAKKAPETKKTVIITSFSQEPIKVFLDCQNYQLNCFEDYIRTEIPFVEFVRDRKLSNVHLLPTYQSTASNGLRVSLIVIGQEIFKNRNDTLNFMRVMNESDSEYRTKLLNHIRAALIPYLAKTNQLDLISIAAIKTNKDSLATLRKESDQKDKWNYWVYNSGISGFIYGDNNYNSTNLSIDFSASRTTEKLKTNISINNNIDVNRYSFEENGEKKTATNTQRNYSLNANIIKSINSHWSYGGFLQINNSLYQNYQLQVYPSAGLEYNFLPYSKYNVKYVVVRYIYGVQLNNYYKTTIFEKLNENLAEQSLGLYSNSVQKWGSIYASLTWQNLMKDFKRNSINFGLSNTIRLTKGLNLSFDIKYSSIKNQVNLEKGDASFEDILIRRRQLATSYSFYMGTRITFAFGSIYNNVVNPRF